MATPIEDQIHKAFIVREDERCRTLENKTGEPAKRREVPKPWTRLGPQALLERPEFLLYVTDCDYDLADSNFQEYCRERGLLHVAGEPDSKRWLYFRDCTKTKNEFLRDPYFRRAQPHEGKRYAYTPQEMETAWRIVCIGRAALQDCWELHRQAAAGSAGETSQGTANPGENPH